MIKKRLITFASALIIAMGVAMITVNVQAAEDASGLVFDEAHYSSRLQSLLKELQREHEITKDPKKTQGEVEKAKEKAYTTAREMLRIIDDRLHKLNIKEGAQLSPTEMLINTHVMVVMLDLLVGEALPHKDNWNYIY